MTLNDAVRLGICRVRAPNWARADAYLKLDLIQKEPHRNEFYMGPWLHLYERTTQEIIKARTPQDVLFATFPRDEDGWVPYLGDIDPEDDYNVILHPGPLTDEQIRAALTAKPSRERLTES